MRFGPSLVLTALLASPALADDPIIPSANAPAEPLYEASRPAADPGQPLTPAARSGAVEAKQNAAPDPHDRSRETSRIR